MQKPSPSKHRSEQPPLQWGLSSHCRHSESCVSSGCVVLTRYAPTVPCANIRAHSDIKNILIFEKHEEFLRGPSASSMSPSLRSGSLCFFTCILSYVSLTELREIETHSRVTKGTHWQVQCFAFRFPWRLHSGCSLAPFLSIQQTVLFHLTSYQTHIQTPRGSVASLRLNIASLSTRRNM